MRAVDGWAYSVCECVCVCVCVYLDKIINPQGILTMTGSIVLSGFKVQRSKYTNTRAYTYRSTKSL